MSKLREFLDSSNLFQSLDEDALKVLEDQLEPLVLSKGQLLVRQDEEGDSMYLLVRGSLGASVASPDGAEIVVEELTAGVTVGEMALLSGQKRSASVVALEDSELLRLSRTCFNHLARTHPLLVHEITHAILPRIDRKYLAGILTGLCGELASNEFSDLENRFDYKNLAYREVLFQEGEQGDAMYILLHGLLRVVIANPDGSERVLMEVRPGDCVGEYALLMDTPRTATVYAVRPSYLACLSRTVFEQLVEKYPQVLIQISRMIIQRHQKAMQVVPREKTTAVTIALMPIRPDISTSKLAQSLVNALASSGSILHLNHGTFEEHYGLDGAAEIDDIHPLNATLAAWLTNQEYRHTYIIFETDFTLTPWTKRCLHHADRIMLVGKPGSDPSLSPLEIASRELGLETTKELVIIHASDTVCPRDTTQWLAQRGGCAIHHVRLNDSADISRLARRITGRALGLVMSGGGFRGMAHIGAIRALEESGIEVDLVGGTSIGSLVAGVVAMGWDSWQMEALAHRSITPQNLLDYTIPLVSFFETRKLTQGLQKTFGDTLIEDLWKSYFCVSCNLSQATQVIHRSGKLWEAIRTSVAVPAVFSPMVKDNALLVDGGLLNNFPLDIMREQVGSGIVIGIELMTHEIQNMDYAFGPSLSGWSILWNRFNPFARKLKVPPIIWNLFRSIEVNSISKKESVRSYADFIIQINVKDYGMLEFANETLIEIGYRAAQEALETWKDKP